MTAPSTDAHAVMECLGRSANLSRLAVRGLRRGVDAKRWFEFRLAVDGLGRIEPGSVSWWLLEVAEALPSDVWAEVEREEDVKTAKDAAIDAAADEYLDHLAEEAVAIEAARGSLRAVVSIAERRAKENADLEAATGYYDRGGRRSGIQPPSAHWRSVADAAMKAFGHLHLADGERRFGGNGSECGYTKE